MPVYDPDAVAYLFPVEGQGRSGAKVAIHSEHNADLMVSARSRDGSPPPPSPQPVQINDRFVREATEQPDESDEIPDEPYLKIPFSKPPKTTSGYVAGCSLNSDLVLPKYKGVSWYHFALTFDNENCLVVRDLNSTVGTRVIYDTEAGERGHGIAWSTCGPALAKGKAPIIKVVGDLQFKLVVPNHDRTSKAYLDNVARFRKGSTTADDLFHDLKLLTRTQTELPTPTGETDTPGVKAPGPMFWKQALGKGVFAVVHYAWDVTTRREYALKEPRKDRGFDKDAWAKEAEMMKDISHDHIVKLKHAVFDDNEPHLYFEFIPKGSLDRYLSVMTTFHSENIAIQLLSGLEYLHTQEIPIVHRDIKPENVLVQTWSSHDVCVKFADFGLSKQASILKTYCGNLAYGAPEVYCLPKDPTYGPLVDIWSLGALIARLECGELPLYPDHYRTSGTLWAEVLVEFVRAHLKHHGTRRLLAFVLECMLVVKPSGRRTAPACHTKALELFGKETRQCDVAISSVESFQTTTDHYAPPLREDDEEAEDENNPSTPKALPADRTPIQQEYGTSLIASLGYDDTGAIDRRLGLVPSDMSEFERSLGVSVETARAAAAAASMVDGDLWSAPVERGKEGGEEGEEEQKISFTESYIVSAILNDLANNVAGNTAVDGGTKDKRTVVEEVLSRKRPKVLEDDKNWGLE
ncbi:Uu.00g136530.m01.CDS01 [Anthostomella pinea]|uniref:Autophagy-related protein 1 n=1 Tax=Anthostomella pinea TaxID=933095 RepID=A0AAI8YKW6_9PEZI|nr:Uu.00g136530.m01.CDS01 [Anthostomella pinea]